jgi:glycosyltransferase involved in cell wall biosynthesis
MPHPDNKPAASKEPVSIALPVYNRANQLEQGVRSWLQFLGQLDRPFEFIIVNDGSSDQTGSLAQSLAGKYPEIVLIHEPAARGFGAALRSALAIARYPLVFYTSLDYPYAPSDLRKLLDRIDDVDLVSGYRSAQRLPPSARIVQMALNVAVLVLIGLKRDKLPGWLGWKARLYYWFVRILLGVHVQDVDSAFKLFRREVFARIPIQSDGMLVHTEIIAKANFMTCWMDEIPIGAASGAKPESLVIPFCWREHFRGLRRLLNQPNFGPPVPQAPNIQEKPANPPAAG